MLALQAYEDATCGGCGGFLPETTAEDAYVAALPTRCYRCTAIGRKSAEYRESEQPQALLYRVERR